MFNGIRENISPTIAAVATLLILFTTSLWLGGAVIALPVELACTGELKPCFVAPEHPKAVELNG